jgi:hypothetical protein
MRTYVFTPGIAGSGTIDLPGKWDLNQLLVITNTTKNTIIYNFADPTYTGTSVTFSRANTASFPQALQNTDGITTIRLGLNTSSMSASDTLQIFVEKNELTVRPWALGTDAFERTRVATPQSMLDADFEYGLQPTKWQTISLVRGYPGIYEIPGTDLQTITGITTDYSSGGGTETASLITVTCSASHLLTAGSPITVKGLDASKAGYARAEGSFIINTVPSSTTFTYYAKARVGSSNGETISTTYTQIRKGGFFTGAAIGSPTFSTNLGGASTTATVTVTFPSAHGLAPGDPVYVSISSAGSGDTLAQGPFYVSTVASSSTFVYNARSVGSITAAPTGSVYVRPDSFYIHRPFDGGVQLGTGGPAHGSLAVRMSKKYIRYQSGKAVNYNTGALFAPNYDLRSLTATGTGAGSTITVTTDDVDHGLQIGATVVISGVTTTGYNGTYVVASIIDERTFTITVPTGTTLGSTTAVLDTPCLVSLLYWHGSTVRAGTFDEQNGMFWQYDGQQLALGLRTSTLQIAGTVSVIPESNTVTGTNTRFTNQLSSGDRIVIRGMSHIVTNVISDTVITVNPDYRGSISASGIKAVKTRDTLIPQSQWNQDRCDGTGGTTSTSAVFNPSGYSLQVNKMQMIGLQWTWYGAGFIDYMLRGPDGNYITVHRIKNSNVNGEAYMRSGNMPVRYEVQNESARSSLASPLTSVGTVMTVTDVTYFPNSGIVMVDNELISFSAKTTATNQLTLSGRAATMTQWVAGTNRTWLGSTAAAHTQGTGVILVSQTATPIISHWGSAFLTDGQFDQDRGYIFNYQATNINAQIRKTTAFAIRLAPSVSNAITGDLGVRELINRAQLLLQGIEITAGSAAAGQALVIEGVLNPSNYPTSTSNITWNSLTSSGQPSFSQVAAGSSITFDNTFTQTISTNSIANTGTLIISLNTNTNLQVGDAVSGSVYLQGATTISAVGSGQVTLNSPLVGQIQSGTQLTFARNQYATPGETIFSFISSPSSKDNLDLSPLKELTNTPIGGRGTYPNGPDVLMINIYVTQGAAINANLVLRWGEAQA